MNSKPRLVIVITEGAAGTIEFSVESDIDVELHVFDFSDPESNPVYHQEVPKTKTSKQLNAYIKRWMKLGKFIED